MEDFKIDYTFGLEPLQQYLVTMADGHLQALNTSWDSRDKAAGGQRWFHLYPDENVDHNDVLHWTKFSHNWNGQCAECHSTNLQKNYSPEDHSFDTTWSEINVACEACHGPASNHVLWAQQADSSIANNNKVVNKGLLNDLSSPAQWLRMADEAIAHNGNLAASHANQQQIDRCGSCHARRSTISQYDNAHFTQSFADNYQLQLLEQPLYYADGQIHDEVYVYGSFLQSKMHQQGVVCSDCHNPHSLELKLPGNMVCSGCHSPQVFDQPEHHHHAANSSGAQCVNCHMPETTYMVVDPRRDHSLRVPRPDLTETLGSPNACDMCHQQLSDNENGSLAADASNKELLAAYREWYPERVTQAHYGQTLQMAATGQSSGLPNLFALVVDEDQPALVKASVMPALARYSSQYALNIASSQLKAADPILRAAAVRAHEVLPLAQRIELLWPLIDDKVKLVRLEVTRLLAAATFTDQQSTEKLRRAIDEYIDAMELSADFTGGQMQLALIYTALNDFPKAEQAYLQAQRIEPQFLPSLLNLADLYRSYGQEQKSKPLFERALQIDPNNPDVNYAFALFYIRQKNVAQSIEYLEAATRFAPNNSRYSYVYAVALFENQQREQAINVLKNALQQYPDDPGLLSAIVSYLKLLGRQQEAQVYQQRIPQQ
jgi:tetratricopeptide (TPR) repeat protein